MNDNDPIQNVETFGEKLSRLLKSKKYLELADPQINRTCKEAINEICNYQAPEIYKSDTIDSIRYAINDLGKCGISSNDAIESLKKLSRASITAYYINSKKGIKYEEKKTKSI